MLWRLRNLDRSFTMGELIDAESYIKSKDLDKVVQLLYRNDKGETPNLNDVDYNTVIGGYNHYMTWRNNIYDLYSSIFNDSREEEETRRRALKKLGLEVEEETQEEKEKNEFQETFGWYHILYTNICNGDVFKMRDAYSMRVIECFNHLVYLKSKK